MLSTEYISSKARSHYKILNVNWDILIFTILSFLISRASIVDELTPFGIAFLSAYILSGRKSSYIFISTVLGIFSFHGMAGFNYVIVATSIMVLYNGIKIIKEFSLIKASIVTGLVFVIIESLYSLIFRELLFYNVLIIAFEGLIVFTMVYIFSYSISKESIERTHINEKIICSLITMALILSGLNDLSIYGVSIKNLITIVFILYFAYAEGALLGSVVGISLGLLSYIAQPEMPFILAIYGLSGLLAGVFKELGKAGTILGFLLGNSIISFYVNGYGISFLNLKELIISISAFLILYEPLNDVFAGFIEPITKRNKEKSYSYRKDEMTIKKLNEISHLFDELAVTFKKSVEDQSNYNVKEVYGLIDNVANNVCVNCGKCSYCWEQKFYSTYNAMFNTICLLEEGISLESENLPPLIKDYCINNKVVKDKIKVQYETMKMNNMWEGKIIKNRLLISEQLEGVAKIMKNMAQEIYINPTFKEDMEQMLHEALRKNKVDIIDVVVVELKKDDIEIYVEIDNSYKKINSQENIKNIISDTLGIPVKGQYNMNEFNKDRVKFKFIRINRYSALTEVISKPNYLNNVSGDNYTFGEGENLHYSAISDGMGAGRKANNESNIAINLLEKFLEAKFDKELALKTINSILMLKSSDEMFTTFDISLIDLYSGKLQIIKTGAPATFIKKKDKVEIINSQSLPVGILKDVDFNIYEEYLEDGDIIIMMSDGLLDSNESDINSEVWMKNVIENINSLNPKIIGEKIMDATKSASSEKAKDDMTVLVTKVWKTIS